MTHSIQSFHHKSSGTFTHIVTCEASSKCAVIDPCYDFDLFSGDLKTEFVQGVVDYIEQNNLICEWILETHAHADHISSAQWLKTQVGGQIAIGEGIKQVQQHFKQVFDFDDDFRTDGSQFDYLFKDKEIFKLGQLQFEVIATPGHTSDSISYKIGNNIFIGDTLFAPNRGSARCDFPGGDAEKLYESIQKLYSLNDQTKLYLCHDYPADGEAPICCVTVAEQKQNNVQVRSETSLKDYVKKRTERDSTLSVPKLIYPSIQVNINAGKLPEPQRNGQRFIKLPIKV